MVKWNEYIVEKDTWEELENLGNVMKLVKKFEKKIIEEEIRRVQMKKQKLLNLEAEMFKRSELPGKYTIKILCGWNNGKFKDKNLKKLERI